MTDVSELQYCTCSKGKTDGYTNIGNNVWVHKTCLKPTYLFWINQMLVDKYWQELDLILERIIEKRESEDGLDKGRAEIACKFIAMLLRPHNPDPTFVRDQAVRRYRERNST